MEFILNTEISSIYSQGGKCRRIHICLMAPDFKTVDKIIAELEKRKVNLKSDGRPIMGMSAKEVVKIVTAAGDSLLSFRRMSGRRGFRSLALIPDLTAGRMF